MKCFVHHNAEASSVCKNCGKAMCIDCSSYSQHSGICPECRRIGFIKEREGLREALSKKISGIVILGIIAIAIIVGSITYGPPGIAAVALFPMIPIGFGVSKCKKYKARIDFLSTEICKLELALNRGSGTI